jgi:hypothetical protein
VAEREPVSTNSLFGEGRLPEQWSRVRELLGDSYVTYWLATTGRDGRPHVRPILVVWVEGSLYFSARETTRKIKNLLVDLHCSISVEWEPLDLVVEGTAVKVRDEGRLKRVADAYASIYDWHVAVRDGAFHDTGGAPTAGPPPYDLYEVIPTTAFGFGLDESFSSTRWRFGGKDDAIEVATPS